MKRDPKPLTLAFHDRQRIGWNLAVHAQSGTLDKLETRMRRTLKENQRALHGWRHPLSGGVSPLSSRGYRMKPWCARDILREQRAIRFILQQIPNFRP